MSLKRCMVRRMTLIGFVLAFSAFHSCPAAADLETDGLCSLFSFLPFTGSTVTDCTGCPSLGFLHMASVLMAMDDFNSRNSSIVPGLDEIIADCPVRFDMNKSAFFDAGIIRHSGIRSLVAQLPELPCAAVGPYADDSAIELSTMAAAFEFPLTVHRSFSLRVSADYASPYSTMVYPDMITTAQYAINLLIGRGRTNYTAFLYALTETGTMWRESVTILLEETEMHYVAYSYNQSPATGNTRSMMDAVRNVKESGYRTILVSLEEPLVDIPLMASAAVSLGLTNGDYVWVFMGGFNFDILDFTDPNVLELLKGSLLVQPYESIWLEDDPFVVNWRNQGPEAIRRLREFSPVDLEEEEHVLTSPWPGRSATDIPGYALPGDFFQTVSPHFGCGFVYDAVIATGLGACAALVESNNVTVDSFVGGIRSTNFMGVSGPVSFGCKDCPLQSSRDPLSITFVAINLFRDTPDENDFNTSGFVLVELYFGGETVILAETVYANGLTSPPELLRDPPEQNYLTSSVRVAGFTALGISLLCSLAAMTWVFICRNHRVLRASQPVFLYVLCLGAIISVSAIFPMSFDEGSGWTESQLSTACVVIPWLFSMGHVLTYGALFGKLWRINKVLQAVRRRINIKQVAWPGLVFFLLALILLSLWTGIEPLDWKREEVDEETGESIGRCDSEHLWAFLGPLVILMLIPTLLTEWMAWRTKDIDEEYAESRWIFIMILVQCEVIVFAVPLVALLSDISPDGSYLGYVALLFTLPTSAVALIIGPKVWAYRNHELGITAPATRRGTTRGEVHVTGLCTNGVASSGIANSPDRLARSSKASCTSIPENEET